MGNRFLQPEVVHIELTDGDWIEVKKDLNNGDQKKLDVCGQQAPISVGGKIIFPVDWAVYEMERALIFLTDWSFQNAKGDKAPITLSSMKALSIEAFDELQTALFRHIEGITQAKKAKRALTTAGSSLNGENSAVSDSDQTSA